MNATVTALHPARSALGQTEATRYVNLHGDYGMSEFVMHRGGILPEVCVAYEAWGQLSVNHDNVILVFTGLSPSAHAASSEQNPKAGWWEYMIGPGKPIDTDQYYVICVNALGGCYGSTGPSSINPLTGAPYGLEFPELSIEDIAKAGHHALLELGIDHLHAVIGSSMGGMVSLAYAVMYPQEVDYLVSISAATRALPFTIAMRSLQREIIRCDPLWNDGQYDAENPPLGGMNLARKLGLVSYRASEEWHQRFDRARVTRDRRHGEPFEMEFEIESYLDYNAKKFTKNFDANSYLYLSRAMDWFDMAEHGGSVNAGLAKIQAKKTLVIGVETDILFPIEQQKEIAEGLIKAGRCVEFASIDSINGHDAFLVDREHFSPVIDDFLRQS